MSGLDVYGLLGTVKTTLTTGMAAALGTLATERSLTLAVPDTTTGYWTHLRRPAIEDIGTLTQPTILLAAVGDAPDGESDFSGHRDVRVDLLVAVLVRGSTADESDARLAAYRDAVVSLLPMYGALGSWFVEYLGTDWDARELTPDGTDYTLQAVASAYAVTVLDQ